MSQVLVVWLSGQPLEPGSIWLSIQPEPGPSRNTRLVFLLESGSSRLRASPCAAFPHLSDATPPGIIVSPHSSTTEDGDASRELFPRPQHRPAIGHCSRGRHRGPAGAPFL